MTVSRDVRMRGFARRDRVEDVLAWIDARTAPLAGEDSGLEAACGRVLAGDVVSPLDVPAFDRSAMDGYALIAAESEGASDYNPLPFSIVGASLPGRPCAATVTPGTAVRIMTGAPLPAGADAVVPAEYATASSGGDRVEITASVSPGKHVGRTGEDVTTGSVVLRAGRRLRPQDVGLLASLGIDAAQAVRRPRVRVLVTGDELVPPGRPRGDYQIYEANSWMLRGLIARDGGDLESCRHLADDRDAVAAALRQSGADIVLISGGSSVGAEDHAPGVLAELGELTFHGVAMRPSSPAGAGLIGDALAFLLPGNPVSCLCSYDFFAGRAIRRLGGRSGEFPYATQNGVLARKIVSAVGRVDYCRVQIRGDEVEPLALSGASILSSTTRADGFVVIPGDSEGLPPGSSATAYLYE